MEQAAEGAQPIGEERGVLARRRVQPRWPADVMAGWNEIADRFGIRSLAMQGSFARGFRRARAVRRQARPLAALEQLGSPDRMGMNLRGPNTAKGALRRPSNRLESVWWSGPQGGAKPGLDGPGEAATANRWHRVEREPPRQPRVDRVVARRGQAISVSSSAPTIPLQRQSPRHFPSAGASDGTIGGGAAM